MKRLLFFLIFSTSVCAWDAPLQELPLACQGRYRPASVAARQIVRTFAHRDEQEALQLLWTLYVLGPTPLQDKPLFWIQSASLKEALALPKTQNRFSYVELNQAFSRHTPTEGEGAQLFASFQLFSSEGAAQMLRILPSRPRPETWLSVKAFSRPGNPTAFPSATYTQLREAHDALVLALREGKDPSSASLAFATLLSEGYATLPHPPAKWQLQLENLYHAYPWPLIAAILYFLAFSAQLLSYRYLAYPLFSTALLLHTALLGARIAILERPPVSNMFETVLYVPWIAMIVTLALRSRLAIAAGAFSSFSLLTLIHLTGIDAGMENVQAVLNSNFWLTIHVLMIVGSYGILIVNGVLAHLYLLTHNETLTHPLRDTLYLGLGLLICGTILGGVWAAESWGRFWDWDPKESWAFITSCIYLIIMHLHRYRWVATFGLAFGCVFGLTSVVFTWYGVNYILGTGLHSYGFGTGGQSFFWGYLFIELLFLTVVFRYRKLFLAKKPNHS